MVTGGSFGDCACVILFASSRKLPLWAAVHPPIYFAKKHASLVWRGIQNFKFDSPRAACMLTSLLSHFQHGESSALLHWIIFSNQLAIFMVVSARKGC